MKYSKRNHKQKRPPVALIERIFSSGNPYLISIEVFMYFRVMVVEDDEILRCLTAEVISLMDIEVFECASADEALLVFDSALISLVITDIHMPGSMNGLEMARVLSDRYPSLPIIIMSGNLSTSDGALPPCAAFLRKPYGLDELHAAIRELLPVD